MNCLTWSDQTYFAKLWFVVSHSLGYYHYDSTGQIAPSSDATKPKYHDICHSIAEFQIGQRISRIRQYWALDWAGAIQQRHRTIIVL
jgi:hypothetical protein